MLVGRVRGDRLWVAHGQATGLVQVSRCVPFLMTQFELGEMTTKHALRRVLAERFDKNRGETNPDVRPTKAMPRPSALTPCISGKVDAAGAGTAALSCALQRVWTPPNPSPATPGALPHLTSFSKLLSVRPSNAHQQAPHTVTHVADSRDAHLQGQARTRGVRL